MKSNSDHSLPRVLHDQPVSDVVDMSGFDAHTRFLRKNYFDASQNRGTAHGAGLANLRIPAAQATFPASQYASSQPRESAHFGQSLAGPHSQMAKKYAGGSAASQALHMHQLQGSHMSVPATPNCRQSWNLLPVLHVSQDHFTGGAANGHGATQLAAPGIANMADVLPSPFETFHGCQTVGNPGNLDYGSYGASMESQNYHQHMIPQSIVKKYVTYISAGPLRVDESTAMYFASEQDRQHVLAQQLLLDMFTMETNARRPTGRLNSELTPVQEGVLMDLYNAWRPCTHCPQDDSFEWISMLDLMQKHFSGPLQHVTIRDLVCTIRIRQCKEILRHTADIMANEIKAGNADKPIPAGNLVQIGRDVSTKVCLCLRHDGKDIKLSGLTPRERYFLHLDKSNPWQPQEDHATALKSHEQQVQTAVNESWSDIRAMWASKGQLMPNPKELAIFMSRRGSGQ